MEHGDSLLTSALRTFVGETDHADRSSADVAQKRRLIRRRCRDALLDCERLLDNHKEAQIARIMNAGEDDVDESDVLDLRPGLSSVIGLTWLLCNQNDRTTSFRNVAERGVEQAMLADGYESIATITVEMNKVEPVEDVVDRARSKDPTDFRKMSNRELNALARAGELTADEYERAVDARFEAMREEGLFDRESGDTDDGGDDNEQ